MSSTFSSCSRERSWKDSVAVTRRSTSSTSHSSSAAIETRCWASTSSGFCGIIVSSISPSRMRRATTAHSSRSPRYLGKIRPLEISPSPCPARPIRCRPRVTDFGDSTWITRSTAPMSMPSSRELRRDEAGQLARLEQLLDQGALLVGQRAVVGSGDLSVASGAGSGSCHGRGPPSPAVAKLLGMGPCHPGARLRGLRGHRARWLAALARLRRWPARSGAWPGARRRGGC